MKDILNHLFEGNTLKKEQAKVILTEIGEGKHNQTQISSFLTVFRMRSITVEELLGFREAMLDLCVKVNISQYQPIDLCGTGGDHKDTFNISTLSSFVVAGAGVNVAKHGNYGVSSFCGSSNVLEYLGIKFTNDHELIEKQLDKAGIAILHAPLFHPAMKNVAPIRRDLGIKTFFNILGPMVNPSRPHSQLVGVFSMELVRLYSYLYQNTPLNNFMILHSLDGYDEVSLTSPFKLVSKNQEQIVDPADFGFKRVNESELSGGEKIEDSAQIFMNVLSGKGTHVQQSAVIFNSALAIKCAGKYESLEDSILAAKESLDSGWALKKFNILKELA